MSLPQVAVTGEGAVGSGDLDRLRGGGPDVDAVGEVLSLLSDEKRPAVRGGDDAIEEVGSRADLVAGQPGLELSEPLHGQRGTPNLVVRRIRHVDSVSSE